jgi:hypothetical protein
MWKRFAVTCAVLVLLAAQVGSQTNVSSPFPTENTATGVTGAAVPPKAIYYGEQASAGLAGHVGCDSSVVYDAATLGSTQLVALVTGKTIYVCGFVLFSAGTANVKLNYGTGAACATGTTAMTPAFQFTAQTGVAYGNSEGYVAKTAASNALCVNSSAAVAVQALVSYAQF